MADLRQARLPNNIELYAKGLSGFSYNVIDEACERIETTEPERGEPAFPRLGRFKDECRRVAEHSQHSSSTHWTIARYLECKAFNDWMRDEIRFHKKKQEDILAARPDMAIAWQAWKSQIASGTMNCPGWCEMCKGTKIIVKFDDGTLYSDGDFQSIAGKQAYAEKRRTQNTAAHPCPNCRRR